jgi:two-component system KDP operon response regulator KdpE
MNNPAARILFIEDDAEIRRFTKSSLDRDGFEVYDVGTIERGLIEAGTRRPDLAVLDLGLPDGDGVDFIKRLRTWSDIPILVLSARTAEQEKITALDAGADDYLMKPFGALELSARVRAHLRRRNATALAKGATLEFGEVKIDFNRRAVERNGARVHVTRIEYRLLTYLTAHPHRVMTHRQVLKSVWGPNHEQDTHYLRVYMTHLRKKVELDPAQPRHLLTETGIGYRFEP